jgi:hypothetical protein
MTDHSRSVESRRFGDRKAAAETPGYRQVACGLALPGSKLSIVPPLADATQRPSMKCLSGRPGRMPDHCAWRRMSVSI